MIEQRTHPGLEQVHSLLMVVLISARPLVWDEDPLLPTCTAYAVVLVVALALTAVECLCGQRPAWRWRASGLVFAALIGWLALAACRSPLPVAGWGLWATSMSDLGLAAYLLQVVPARASLALGALGAGLMGEAVISVLQWPWVLPAMAKAQLAGRLGAVPNQLQAALAERIANGGLYGTFTQANALGGYLLLASAPVAAAAWRRGAAMGPRVLATLILTCAALAFLGTASKGALIAAAAATLGVWWWRRWRGRYLVTIAAVVLTVGAWQVHGIRQGLHDSAQVRLGYWSGAWQLVREAPWLGHGLRSFGEEAPRVLPLWASFSSQVHCEVLSCACESGLPGAALLVALLALVLMRPLPRSHSHSHSQPLSLSQQLAATPQATMTMTISMPMARWLPWGLGGCILYFALLGLLDSNTGWWPGSGIILGGLPVVQMLWWVAVAALIASTCRLLAGLPTPSPVACRWGLAVVVLHSLIDFDLHAGGIVGTMVVVAVLGGLGGAVESTPSALTAPQFRIRIGSLCAAGLVLALACALVGVQGTCMRMRAARTIADTSQALMQATSDPSMRLALVQQIAVDAGVAPPPEGDATPSGEALAQTMRQALTAAMVMAGGDRELQTRLLLLLPPGPERLAMSQALAALRPASAVVESQCAYDQQVIAEGASPGSSASESAWRSAYEHMTRAVLLNPADLRAHHDLARMLDAAAAALPERAPMLRRLAQEQRELIERERPLVDPSNRD